MISRARMIAGLTLLLLAALPLSAQAQQAFVTDRIVAPLLDAPSAGAQPLAALPTGSPLTVLKRAEKYLQVRDAEGRVGWLAAEFVSRQEPAMATLLRVTDAGQRTKARRGDRALPHWAVGLLLLLTFGSGFGIGVFWLDWRIRERHGGFRV